MSSILPQNHATIRPSQRVLLRTPDNKIGRSQPLSHTSYHFLQRARVFCVASTSSSATITAKPPPPIPEPQLANQEPLIPLARSILNDPSLKSTWVHRAWIATGCTTVLISLAKSVTSPWAGPGPIIAGCIGYVLSDLASGVYHWGIDNYGDAKTPFFGNQIDAFQGHHKYPWTITKREFANNLHALARAVTFTVLPIDIFCNDPVFHGFVCVCSGCIMFSQQFHSWAHGTKSKLPRLVVALQDAGILVSRSQHGEHHRAPYNNNYCIVSGAWNEYLDGIKFFEVLEMVFFFKFGVRPRSWSEPDSEWTEDTETQSLIASH